jgi:hypothetical protein
MNRGAVAGRGGGGSLFFIITRIGFFRNFIQSRFGVDVVFGTHPIPQKYYLLHRGLHTWDAPFWQEVTRDVMGNEEIRRAYD